MSDLELYYTKASDNYIVVNNKNKTYALVTVKYKNLKEIEKVFDMKILKKFENIKEFKKEFRRYK